MLMKKVKGRLSRLIAQFPLVPAYCFTDYCAQGQTISNVLIDFAKLPSGKVSLFNTYVALSRTNDPVNMCLLRGFDVTTLQQGREAALIVEGQHITEAGSRTKRKVLDVGKRNLMVV